ncbi:MAG: reverse transcriptase domain-containing protein, partial [Pseudomonadota bacterium]
MATIGFSKAFDKTRKSLVKTHKSVLEACVKFDLPKQSVKWIASYLSGRQQRVSIKNVSSPFVGVTCGVPQGSVLGPLLFAIVMDSLKPNCSNTTFVKYADDLSVLHFVRNCEEDSLQTELNEIACWTARHSLMINMSKSCVMNVITKRSIMCDEVMLCDTYLKVVSNVKVLGCELSDDMKWNIFVDSLVRKASQRIYLILNLKRANCPPALLFNAYCAYIRSILLYAFPVICNMPLYLRNKLSRVERRVLRIINSSDFEMCDLLSAGDRICANLFEKVV